MKIAAVLESTTRRSRYLPLLAWGISIPMLACNPSDRQPCATDTDCAAHARCVQSFCSASCVSDSDCVSKSDACVMGSCQPVPNPECEADDDCTTPGPCQIGAGASCVGGLCRYRPQTMGLPCDDRSACTADDACDGAGACVGATQECTLPPAECIENDTVLVKYERTGPCDPATGECSYRRTQEDCLGCTRACLVMCEGITCPDKEGGCQIQGHCLPTTPTGRCEYVRADEGTHCVLPGQSTAEGFCTAGRCVECLSAADCARAPGHPACFAAACTGGACSYDLQPSATCERQRCVDGVIYAVRTCDAAGGCPEPEVTSCLGYACDSAGNGCRTSCYSSSECVPGLACRSDRTCEPPRDNGALCQYHGECASSHCECADAACGERRCAPAACPCGYDAGGNGSCDGDLDDGVDDARNTCGASSCNGQGGCNLPNGTACTDAWTCESDFCADGVCCDAACTGDCAACNLAGSVGVCTGRPAGDTTECNGCHACSGPGGACAPQSAAEGKNCTGACTSCNAGQCTPRNTGDAAECGTCRACNGGVCAAVSAADGKNCEGTDTYCCGGVCVNPPATPSELGAACGSGDCTGTWGCAGTEARCSSYGGGCDVCDGDFAVDGTCTGDAFGTSCLLLSSLTECGACVTCLDGGASASCAAFYPRNTDDTQGTLVCAGPAVACDGSGACKRDLGQSCTAADQCASGFCVDGVCCESTCATCYNCNQSGRCEAAPNGQQDAGCNAAATTCSNADTCDGQGQCLPNHLGTGSEGNGGGCPTCQDCNGAGACDNVGSGQVDVGCSSCSWCSSGRCVPDTDPCCGDPCCGDPCCGDPCCGDPDPCCGSRDPCCLDPDCCGRPGCIPR